MASRDMISRLFRPSICSICRRAPFSTSTRLSSDNDNPSERPSTYTPSTSSGLSHSELRDLAAKIRLPSTSASRFRTTGLVSSMDSASSSAAALNREQPHHLHIYSHKHNTHITLTRPDCSPVLSLSAGNIGFRKAARGTYDAAFQLAAYAMRMIQDRGLLREVARPFEDDSFFGGRRRAPERPIRDLELVVRGWGKGREAVTKALLGAEGRVLRDKIRAVSDGTRLKFGGTRGQNPRRLG